MAAFRSLFVVLVFGALMSDALFIPAGTIPIIIGAKVVLVPKIIALKAGIGMLGLKIAGARYLKEKVLIPASLAGAVAGYKATSAFMDAPRRLIEAKTLAVEKLIHSLPSLPSLPTLPAVPSNFQTTFKVPALPVPSVEWETKTVNVPKVVFSEPPTKTITISKHIEPAYAPPPKDVVIVNQPTY